LLTIGHARASRVGLVAISIR